MLLVVKDAVTAINLFALPVKNTSLTDLPIIPAHLATNQFQTASHAKAQPPAQCVK